MEVEDSMRLCSPAGHYAPALCCGIPYPTHSRYMEVSADFTARQYLGSDVTDTPTLPPCLHALVVVKTGNATAQSGSIAWGGWVHLLPHAALLLHFSHTLHSIFFGGKKCVIFISKMKSRLQTNAVQVVSQFSFLLHSSYWKAFLLSLLPLTHGFYTWVLRRAVGGSIYPHKLTLS